MWLVSNFCPHPPLRYTFSAAGARATRPALSVFESRRSQCHPYSPLASRQGPGLPSRRGCEKLLHFKPIDQPLLCHPAPVIDAATTIAFAHTPYLTCGLLFQDSPRRPAPSPPNTSKAQAPRRPTPPRTPPRVTQPAPSIQHLPSGICRLHSAAPPPRYSAFILRTGPLRCACLVLTRHGRRRVRRFAAARRLAHPSLSRSDCFHIIIKLLQTR